MPAVYCILLFDSDKPGHARKALDVLAQQTSGKAFYPGNEAQLTEMARQIAQEIRNR